MRGYDAVRIDVYPHLIAAGADRTWELIPVWSLQDWGSPAKNRVRVNRLSISSSVNAEIAGCEWGFLPGSGGTRGTPAAKFTRPSSMDKFGKQRSTVSQRMGF